MFSNRLNFGHLPKELRFEIVNWLHDEEAHQLLHVNKTSRDLILRRGNLPKYIEEIKLWCRESTNGNREEEETIDSALRISLFYRKNDVSKEDFKEKRLLTMKSIKDAIFWKQIQRIAAIKKLVVTVSDRTNEFSSKAQREIGKDLRFFSTFTTIHLFHFCASLNFANLFFAPFNPVSIEFSSIFIWPNYDTEGDLDYDGIEPLYMALGRRPFVQNSKFLNIGSSEYDKWLLASQTQAEHVEFNCDHSIFDIEETLEQIVEGGIPSRNSSASCQIRSRLYWNRLTRDKFYNWLIERMQRKNPIEIINRSHLTENELISLKRLQYLSASRYTVFKGYAIDALTCPRPWLTRYLEDRDSEQNCIYFNQMLNGEKVVGLFYLEEKRGDEDKPFMDICIIWLRSACVEKIIDTPIDMERPFFLDRLHYFKTNSELPSPIYRKKH